MSADSKIEWTDHTFNPWWGCVKVSPGCKHCYAEGIANRFGDNIWGPAATSDRKPQSDDYWRKPHVWNRRAEAAGEPAFVFCASMADVFEDHPQVGEHRERLWEVIEDTPWLTWQLLTKRPENVADMVPWGDHWPDNVWIGTSVEDQQRADERVSALLEIPAPVRFLSVEPLIGPVRLDEIRATDGVHYMPLTGTSAPEPRIHWVIVGGESGPDARPMEPQWALSLRDQCADADVPFFFKQWGAWAPHVVNGSAKSMLNAGKKAAGRTLDGRTHNDRPPAHVPTPAAQGRLL